jgi:hypothetical protein
MKYEVELQPGRWLWGYTVRCDDPYFRAFAMIPRPTKRWAQWSAHRAIKQHAAKLARGRATLRYPVEVEVANADDTDTPGS